ncbi:hypothetical protein [Pseudoteredinibacter isoporae]|uniref:Solute-binding protein family 3/N-terminal domain-containing protein n=1 Tax=Pseudoteredinibacter isoporae TaxID=570281 RepID=A0A7X0MWX6_9GAMM|nr:hypothetical protein [Pseudoteredinibacter isoporae]MBB6522888.1 hypothetical protein [Pseudoteredinibacter isoporae]NHO88414.1 hypothetical protein [Pseudoteredinibacter isoporae]NIB23255.1 hypothetical protein [Pseudoteredinibacter isoporae]
MKIKLTRIIVASCFLLMAMKAWSQDSKDTPQGHELLQMVVTNIAPWGSLNKGMPEGLYVNLLQDIGREWGKAYQLKVMPYARVVRDIEMGKADLSVLFDSPGAEAAGHRILPLPPVDVIVVMRDDLELKDLETRPEIKIGRLRLGFYGEKSLRVREEQWLSINSIAQGVGMLERKRLHMLVTTAPAYKYALRRLNIDGVDGVRAVHVDSVRGSIFLSRLSELPLERVKAAAKRAMVRHWDELQAISQLHNASNVLHDASLDYETPTLAGR